MSLRTFLPAQNLREMATRLSGLERRTAAPPPPPVLARDGDGSTTAFACTTGYRPLVVWRDGTMQREGSGGSYGVDFDGVGYSVVFAVAPAAAARIDILQWPA